VGRGTSARTELFLYPSERNPNLTGYLVNRDEIAAFKEQDDKSDAMHRYSQSESM